MPTTKIRASGRDRRDRRAVGRHVAVVAARRPAVVAPQGSGEALIRVWHWRRPGASKR